MNDDYTTNSHYLTYTFLFERLGEYTFWTLKVGSAINTALGDILALVQCHLTTKLRKYILSTF